MSLGQRLFELRKEKKLSQEEVADILGVSRQTISKWETDASTPDFDKIVPICELYEISTDELLTGEKKESLNEEKGNALTNEEKNLKRTKGIVISILIYIIAVSWLMASVAGFNFNPVLSTSIFLIVCGIATCIIIYSNIAYKKDKTEKEKKEDKLYKQIDDILGLITLIIYLLISFITMAWHITWIIWLIYALIMEIIKLIISLRGNKNEK